MAIRSENTFRFIGALAVLNDGGKIDFIKIKKNRQHNIEIWPTTIAYAQCDSWVPYVINHNLITTEVDY